MDKIRWGIIGTGDVADRKGVPALYKADRSELAGVTNRTVASAESFASAGTVVDDPTEAPCRRWLRRRGAWETSVPVEKPRIFAHQPNAEPCRRLRRPARAFGAGQ